MRPGGGRLSPRRRRGTLPVVVDYIPYRKDEVNIGVFRHYLGLARAGYAVAQVDIRGTGASEGRAIDEYVPSEQEDGYDLVEWIAEQPWCDGHVNLMGISYGGFTALQVATHRPPHLTSIIPSTPPTAIRTTVPTAAGCCGCTTTSAGTGRG